MVLWDGRRRHCCSVQAWGPWSHFRRLWCATTPRREVEGGPAFARRPDPSALRWCSLQGNPSSQDLRWSRWVRGGPTFRGAASGLLPRLHLHMCSVPSCPPATRHCVMITLPLLLEPGKPSIQPAPLFRLNRRPWVLPACPAPTRTLDAITQQLRVPSLRQAQPLD